MKTLELTQATATLVDYVQNMGPETHILSIDGQPVAALMPLENLDMETISLSTNPEFLAILAESRASLKAEGGIPLAEVKQRLGLA